MSMYHNRSLVALLLRPKKHTNIGRTLSLDSIWLSYQQNEPRCGGLYFANGANLAPEVDGPDLAFGIAPAHQGCQMHLSQTKDRVWVLFGVYWCPAPSAYWCFCWSIPNGGWLALLHLVLWSIAQVSFHVPGPVWGHTHAQSLIRRGPSLPVPLVEEAMRQADGVSGALLPETGLIGLARYEVEMWFPMTFCHKVTFTGEMKEIYDNIMRKSTILWLVGFSGTSLAVGFFARILLDYLTIGRLRTYEQDQEYKTKLTVPLIHFQKSKSYLESVILWVTSSLSTILSPRVSILLSF